MFDPHGWQLAVCLHAHTNILVSALNSEKKTNNILNRLPPCRCIGAHVRSLRRKGVCTARFRSCSSANLHLTCSHCLTLFLHLHNNVLQAFSFLFFFAAYVRSQSLSTRQRATQRFWRCRCAAGSGGRERPDRVQRRWMKRKRSRVLQVFQKIVCEWWDESLRVRQCAP